MLQYPAALHATILLAASHLGKEQSSQSYTVDLPQLRSMAVREISKSLAVEARGVSDHLIAAVMQMASYEALFGEWSICDTHMRGLKQMVSLRGGLSALGLGGVLEHACLWVDSNILKITGTSLYFDEREFPPSSPDLSHPQPSASQPFAIGLL